MKNLLKYLACGILLTLFFGCRPNTPDPLTDGTPRIVSIKFPGIPVEDVSIDQQNFVITVKVPPLLPVEFEPEVKVKLTENAKLRYASFAGLFAITDNRPPISLSYADDNQNYEASAYTLKLLPTGPLSLVNSGSPVEFVLNNGQIGSVYFPTRNLYGNELPSKVRFTNRESKETVILENQTSNAKYSKGWGTEANNLSVDIYNLSFVPGLHDVELIMKDGQILRYAQPLSVKKGPVSLGWAGDILYAKIKPGEKLVIQGRNLFAGDISVALVDSTDHAMTLESLEFQPNGNHLKIQIPAAAGYGHHVLRFSSNTLPFQNNAPGEQTACRRLYIRGQNSGPYEILFLTDGLVDCSIKGPVLVRKNKFVGTWVTGIDTKVRLKMVSVQNTENVHFGRATTVSSGNVEAGSNVFIPDEVPVGQYRVALQVLDEAGKLTQEGPTFWRIVEVH